MDIDDPHTIIADPLVDGVDPRLWGDNASEVGEACRGLPENRRRSGLLPSPCRGAMREEPRG